MEIVNLTSFELEISTEAVISVNGTDPPNNTQEIPISPVKSVQFVFLGVLIPLVAIVGVVGNVLILVVMTRRNMVGPTNCLLAALAVSDAALLLLQIPYYYVVHGSRSSKSDGLSSGYYWIVWYVASHVFVTSTCWLTTALVIERFHGLRSKIPPPQYYSCSQLKRVILAAVAIFLVAVLFNVSKCFEFQPGSSVSGMRPTRETWLLDVAAYVKTRAALYTVLVVLLPVVLMIVFNSLLLRHLLGHRRDARLAGGREAGFRLDLQHITVSVFAVVLIFVLCYSLEVYNSLNLTIHGRGIYMQRGALIAGVYLKNFLTVVNSSVNFLVYVTVNPKFRKTLATVFSGLASGSGARLSGRETIQFVSGDAIDHSHSPPPKLT